MSAEPPVPAAIAATETPVQLTVSLVDDERVPEGMVCMGSFRNGRLVARSVMPPEAWAQIEEYGIFDEPIQVVLVARAGPPGLQCQLYAMVPLPDDDEEEEDEEPWAASVPGSSYEAAVEGEGDEDPTGRAAGGPDPAGPHRPLRSRPGAPREPAARGGGRAEEDHRREYDGDGGPGAGGPAGALGPAP